MCNKVRLLRFGAWPFFDKLLSHPRLDECRQSLEDLDFHFNPFSYPDLGFGRVLVGVSTAERVVSFLLSLQQQGLSIQPFDVIVCPFWGHLAIGKRSFWAMVTLI